MDCDKLSLSVSLSHRLHPESGSADPASAATGTALPVCPHRSASLCWPPDLKVSLQDMPIQLLNIMAVINTFILIVWAQGSEHRDHAITIFSHTVHVTGRQSMLK